MVKKTGCFFQFLSFPILKELKKQLLILVKKRKVLKYIDQNQNILMHQVTL